MENTKTLLRLHNELIVTVFLYLDARSLVCTISACTGLRQIMAPTKESLRRRAAANGRVCPTVLPCGVPPWAAYLMQRNQATRPHATGPPHAATTADDVTVSPVAPHNDYVVEAGTRHESTTYWLTGAIRI